MTQEQKELLLKDLCARLPYGVKVHVKNWSGLIMEWIENDYVVKSAFPSLNEVHVQSESGSLNVILGYDDYEFKPYLFPLSSMTEEQKEYISNRWGINDEFNFEINPDWGEYSISYIEAQEYIEWLKENHFDDRRMIEKGLAIDATNLNIY